MKEPTENPTSSISFQQNICRTCLRRISATKSMQIFSNKPFYKNQMLSQLFNEITSTLLDSNDMLPKKVCLRCAERLKCTIAFKRSIERADKTLRCKLRKAEVSCYMDHSESLLFALNALCGEIHEIKDEYSEYFLNEKLVETVEPNLKQKTDVNVEALQVDLKKTINTPRNSNNNNKPIRNKNTSQHTVINNEEEFIKTSLDNKIVSCEAKDIGVDTVRNDNTITFIVNEENSTEEPNDCAIIEEMLQSEISDAIILVEDWQESNAVKEEQTWSDSKSDLISDPKTFTMDVTKPLACSKCDKRFTNLNILQRHLLYHSLNLEPTDTHTTCAGSMNVSDLYQKAEQIKKSYSKVHHTKIMEKRVKQATATCNTEATIKTSCTKTLAKVNSDVELIPDLSDHTKYCFGTARISEPMILPSKPVDPQTVIKKQECKYCKNEFTNFLLRKHYIKEHTALYQQDLRILRKARNKCTICQKGHNTPKQLQSHMRAQHELRFKCNCCGKGFKKKRELHMHLLRSHGVTNTSFSLCYICGKMITYMALSMHIQSHTATKSIKCTVKGCNALLKYHKSLPSHIKRVHELERPFICEHCGKAFAVREGLAQHKRSHWETMPHHCEICGQGFSAPNRLKRHYLSLHQRAKPYKCPMCPQVFAQNSSIKKHCVRFHPEHPIAQNTPQCLSKKYPPSQSFKAFECTLCNRKFAHEYNLKKHTGTFHPLLH